MLTFKLSLLIKLDIKQNNKRYILKENSKLKGDLTYNDR